MKKLVLLLAMAFAMQAAELRLTLVNTDPAKDYKVWVSELGVANPPLTLAFDALSLPGDQVELEGSRVWIELVGTGFITDYVPAAFGGVTVRVQDNGNVDFFGGPNVYTSAADFTANPSGDLVLTATQLPEPSGIALAGAGLACLAVWRSRQRRRQ